jgi:hypothetical protein
MKTLLSKLFKCRLAQTGALLALIAAAVASLAWSEPQSNKLEGAWVGTVPNTPMTWSYTLVPDSSGQSAAMAGSIQVPITPAVVVPGLFTNLEYFSPMVGRVTMTGPDTAEFTCVYYGMKKGFPFNQVVFIGVNSGQCQFVAPDKIINTNHLAFYAPTADADHDGLPDPGQVPALCLPATVSLETRVPIMPPCTALTP